MSETTLKSERIYSGGLIGLRIDTVGFPNGKTGTRAIVEHRGAVCIVPVLNDGRIVLVRQYRTAVGEELLEVPAGTLNPGEGADDCAARELIEETNYEAGRLEKILFTWLAPGYSTEAMHYYLARDLTPCEGQQDEDEFVEVELVAPERVWEMIFRGEIKDAKTVAALLVARRLLKG